MHNENLLLVYFLFKQLKTDFYKSIKGDDVIYRHRQDKRNCILVSE